MQVKIAHQLQWDCVGKPKGCHPALVSTVGSIGAYFWVDRVLGCLWQCKSRDTAMHCRATATNCKSPGTWGTSLGGSAGAGKLAGREKFRGIWGQEGGGTGGKAGGGSQWKGAWWVLSPIIWPALSPFPTQTYSKETHRLPVGLHKHIVIYLWQASWCPPPHHCMGAHATSVAASVSMMGGRSEQSARKDVLIRTCVGSNTEDHKRLHIFKLFTKPRKGSGFISKRTLTCFRNKLPSNAGSVLMQSGASFWGILAQKPCNVPTVGYFPRPPPPSVLWKFGVCISCPFSQALTGTCVGTYGAPSDIDTVLEGLMKTSQDGCDSFHCLQGTKACWNPSSTQLASIKNSAT